MLAPNKAVPKIGPPAARPWFSPRYGLLCVACTWLALAGARATQAAIVCGVVKSKAAGSFVLNGDNGGVYVFHPNRAAILGHPEFPPGFGPVPPDTQIPFSALRPGMRVYVLYHWDSPKRRKMICTEIQPGRAPPGPRTKA